MKNRVFRALCALVLVCVLLVSWSPIQVKANTLAMAGSAILSFFEAGAAAAGMSVFSYVAIGLGLTLGAAKLADAVGEYIEYSGNLGAKIYYYPDGSWTYGVDLGFIDSVRAFLFDAGYLVDTGCLTTVVPEGQTYRTFTADAPCVAFMYSYSYYVTSRSQYYFAKEGYLLCTVPSYKFSVNGVKATSSVTFDDNTYYIYSISSGGKYLYSAQLTETLAQPSDFYYVGDCGSTYTLQRVLENYGWGGIQGSGDTVTEYVAPLDVALDEAYPEWYGNSRPYVTPGTEEEVAVLPIPYNPTADPDAAPGVLTQPDIWQGSIADPIPGIGTGSDTTISVTPWETFKTWISTGWQSIIQAIPTAGTIADAIGNVITSIFVPTADFLQPKIEELKARFPFIDGVIGLGHFVRDNLSSDLGPPVIYVDFGSATTDLFGHKKYLLTDFSWYAPYKPTVDALMSSILWAFFGWRVFVRLPSIISGEGGQVAFLALSDLRRREDEYMESEKQRARGDKE